MPRFLHPDAPALNSYLSAKARVVKRNRKKYENWDSAYQKELASLGQAQQGASVIFDNLLNIFTTIETSAIEMKAVVQLASRQPRGGPSGFTDRFLSSNTSLVRAMSSLQQQMQKLNYSFNIFSEAHIADLRKLFVSVTRLINDSVQIVSAQVGGLRNWLPDTWDELTPSWVRPWTDMAPLIADGLRKYKYSLTSTSSNEPILATTGAGRRTRSCRIIGGQGPAGREPFQFTTFASNLGTYPPRNTQDLLHLPRRFL